jgi:hypothetical protein
MVLPARREGYDRQDGENVKRSSMFLLLAAAIVGLVVLGALGPGRERPTRSIGPSPPEAGTDGADVECRVYVSLGTSTASSATAGVQRIYVTVSGTTGSVVRYRVDNSDGCASAEARVTVPRHRP